MCRKIILPIIIYNILNLIFSKKLFNFENKNFLIGIIPLGQENKGSTDMSL